VRFNPSNYDKNYIAGIYNFLDQRTDKLIMNSSGTNDGQRITQNSIHFDLTAPSNKINYLYKQIVKYIQDSPIENLKIIESKLPDDLIWNISQFLDPEKPSFSIDKKHNRGHLKNNGNTLSRENQLKSVPNLSFNSF
jgi:hypothetical protein